LFYDGDSRVLKLYNDIPDVALDIGEENWVRVVNKTGSQINNGQVVYINGAQGNRPTIALADNREETKADTIIGVATHDIGDNQEGFVTTFGLVREVNTSTYTEGDALYVGENGALINVKPETPLHSVLVGYAVNSTNNGQIIVSIQKSGEIEDLHNVSISGASDGQVLTYSQSLSAWTNEFNISDYATQTQVGTISGDLDALELTVATNTSDISTLQTQVGAISAQGSSILSFTADISAQYTTATDDSSQVIYVSNGPVIMNQSPASGEHLWINNEGSVNVLLSGGVNTIKGKQTQTLPVDSTYHLHFNDKEWRVI
jgi:hypothetical protein